MITKLIGIAAMAIVLSAADKPEGMLSDAASVRVLKEQNEMFAIEIKRLQAALASAEFSAKVAEAGCKLNATVAAVTPDGYELTPELKLKAKPVTAKK